MRFPSIKTIRKELTFKYWSMRCNQRRDFVVSGSDDATMDIRLNVHSDGSWIILSGDSSYDQNHQGYWGASCLSWERQNLEKVAKSLIEQVKADSRWNKIS